MKKVLIITSSFRNDSNSNILAEEVAKGAANKGHEVSFINLSNMKMNYCHGCQACEKLGKCIQKDDMNEDVILKIIESDVIILATPIYFYEMAGQMKTFFDRTVPLFYKSNVKPKDVYGIFTCQDSDTHAVEAAINGIKGWVICFPYMTYKGEIRGLSLDKKGESRLHKDYLDSSYKLGESL